MSLHCSLKQFSFNHDNLVWRKIRFRGYPIVFIGKGTRQHKNYQPIKRCRKTTTYHLRQSTTSTITDIHTCKTYIFQSFISPYKHNLLYSIHFARPSNHSHCPHLGVLIQMYCIGCSQGQYTDCVVWPVYNTIPKLYADATHQ